MRERTVASCGLAVILSLFAVGLVSHTEVRHAVQTAPIWIPVVFAWRESPLSRWLALPVFLFWLTIMTLIWLFLLGVARVVHGHFTPAEIALTLVIGTACVWGAVACLKAPSAGSKIAAAVSFLGMASLQWIALRLSMLPAIEHR
jgi:hypothetical protein